MSLDFYATRISPRFSAAHVKMSTSRRQSGAGVIFEAYEGVQTETRATLQHVSFLTYKSFCKSPK